MSYLLVVVAAAGCGVFGASTFGKLRRRAAYEAFVASLRPLHVVPDRAVPVVAALVAAAEVVITAGLAATLTQLGAGAPARPIAIGVLTLAACLLAVLTAGIVMALRAGRVTPCACFGTTGRPLSRRHVARNLLLTAAVLGGLVAAPSVDVAPPLPGTVLAAAAGFVVAAVIVRIDDLVDLFLPTSTVSGSPKELK